MVGVAGGSRGCLNCRRRKIKCDEQQPACKKCLWSRLECQGPVKGLIFRKQQFAPPATAAANEFVDSVYTAAAAARPKREPSESSAGSSPSSVPSSAAGSALSSQSSSRTGSVAHSDDDKALEFDEAIPRDAAFYTRAGFDSSLPHDAFYTDGGLPLSMLSPGLDDDAGADPAAVRSLPIYRGLAPTVDYSKFNYYLRYFMTSFAENSNDVVGVVDEAGVTQKTWYTLLPQFILSPTETSLANISRALVMTYYGGLCSDKELQEEGILLYMRALRLQRMLIEDISAHRESARLAGAPATAALARWAPTMVSEGSVITSCLLIIYEMLNKTTHRAWVGLADGALRLMELRGPEVFRQADMVSAQSIFHNLRGFILVTSLILCQPSFMHSPEWHIPVDTIPAPRKFHVELHNIAFELPTLRAGVRKFFDHPYLPYPLRPEHNNPKSMAEMARLYRRLHEIDGMIEDLEQRYAAWNRENDAEVENRAAREVIYSHDQRRQTMFRAKLGRVCPAHVGKRGAWAATHFFKPPIEYRSEPHAHMHLLAYACRIGITMELASLAAYYVRDSHPDMAYAAYKAELARIHAVHRQRFRKFSSLICRSAPYLICNMTGADLFTVIFPLKASHVVMEDSYSKGWIYNWLMIIKHAGIHAATDHENNPEQSMREYEAFLGLDVCKHCGERLRPAV
ncbi:uncharacterized protein V1510DRAFT_421538 [Dipodascopsis tothii]|uniref:uncharacterized protein n=1 Tax=Dipodascopsis tothii TaxID=44089 RepID=UPI0034CE0B8F